MDITFVRNLSWPANFFVSYGDDTVGILMVYGSTTKDPSKSRDDDFPNNIIEFGSKDMERFRQEIITEFSLQQSHFDWGYIGGRALFSIHKSHLLGEGTQKISVYDIVNAFLRRNVHVYMNDSTQVTFDPCECPVSRELHEKKLAESFQRSIEGYYLEVLNPAFDPNVPENWITEEGKNIARKLSEIYSVVKEAKTMPEKVSVE